MIKEANMRMTRRSLLTTAVASAPALTVPAWAASGGYPERPVRFVVPFGVGGAIDVAWRTIGDGLFQQWGTPVIVENRTGASGAIAAQYVAGNKPDGHTVLLAGNSLLLLPLVRRDVTIDLERDFIPVGAVAELRYAFVADKSAPYSSLSEYIAYARQKPQGATYGSVGHGSSVHLFGEYLAKKSGANLIHVPYTGSAEVGIITDMGIGALDAGFFVSSGAYNHARSGRIKVLAVSGANRLSVLPNVATFAEQGFGDLNITGWLGACLSAGTPPAAVETLSANLNRTMRQPKIKQTLTDAGFEARQDTPEAFRARIRAERQQWKNLIDAIGFKPA